MGRVSTTIYNANAQVIATVDPNGLRTSFIYDAAGRQIATATPAGPRPTTLYDDCCAKPQSPFIQVVRELAFLTTLLLNGSALQHRRPE